MYDAEKRREQMGDFMAEGFKVMDSTSMTLDEFLSFYDNEISNLVGALSFMLAFLPLGDRERVMAEVKDEIMSKARDTGGSLGLLESMGVIKKKQAEG